MPRRTLAVVGCLLLGSASLWAQTGIQRAKVKKVDAGQGVLILTVDGKDQEFGVSADTRLMAGDGKALADGLKDSRLKEGTAVMFKAVSKDGKNLLIGLRLFDGDAGKGAKKDFVKKDTAKLKPLTAMGGAEYHGFKGGLYPDGKNERPAAHEKAGLALAQSVQPLDGAGKPDPQGKIVLLGVGMSNTTQVFSAFKQQADADKDRNPKLVIVDGAQGGMTASRIMNPADNASGTKYWSEVERRLKMAGVTHDQVQVAWIKQAEAGPSQGFPGYAKILQSNLTKLVQAMHARFPNLKMVYLSGRTYGGYARSGLNPEPYAFESGYSVKWLIEEQLKGEPALNFDSAKGNVSAPWLSWGPYLWANGTTKNADGLFYEETDFAADGTHHSPSGRQKVGAFILTFFKTDSTSRPWFLAR